ncbi:ABC transporter permease [uncultured Anaerococcus sp.]|uniref:ABC transporter permease n=1 Tax=uncultured Anaerococcus sp. TaxID=293428 RepID=UPI0026292E5E|nr:ABC transporter permease [uncultured Anaerococcus sp.]
MRISDRFIMALRNLWRRKSRTILTILSVVIGSTSIILMLAFAQGISNSQKEMVDSFQGLTTIEVMNSNGDESINIDDRVINELNNVDHVKAVVPSKNIYTEFKIADTDEYQMEGSLSVIPDNIFTLLTNDMLEWGDIPNTNETNTVLLGSAATANEVTDYGDGGMSMEPVKDFDYQAHEYFIRLGYKDENEDDGVNFGNNQEVNNPDNSNSMEAESSQKPKTADVPIKISGKLNNKAFLSGWNSYISETSYKELEKEDAKLASPTLSESVDDKGNPIKADSSNSKIKYDSIQAIVDDTENVEAAEAEIRKLGYQTNSMAETSKEIESSSKNIMLILGGIGSIAFIVSAIGIINTMLMSIYERQKEIGVMKVIGASVSDIQTMFLIESGFIGFFGGILGLLISLLVGKLINGAIGGMGDAMMETSNMIVIPPWLALVGVGFSALVGVLAGYLPARRATKLSAIDALRSN